MGRIWLSLEQSFLSRAYPVPGISHSGCKCHYDHDLLLGIIPHFRVEDTDTKRYCDIPSQQVMQLKSCPELGTLHIFSHFILLMTPADQYCQFHLTNTENVSTLPRVKRLANGKARIQTQNLLAPKFLLCLLGKSTEGAMKHFAEQSRDVCQLWWKGSITQPRVC